MLYVVQNLAGKNEPSNVSLALKDRHFISDVPPFQPFRVKSTYFRLRRKFEEEIKEAEENEQKEKDKSNEKNKIVIYNGSISRHLVKSISIGTNMNQDGESTPSLLMNDEDHNDPYYQEDDNNHHHQQKIMPPIVIQRHKTFMSSNINDDSFQNSNINMTRQYVYCDETSTKKAKKKIRPSSAAVVRKKRYGNEDIDTLMSKRVRQNVNKYLKKHGKRPKSASNLSSRRRMMKNKNSNSVPSIKRMDLSQQSNRPSSAAMIRNNSISNMYNKFGNVKSLGELYGKRMF